MDMLTPFWGFIVLSIVIIVIFMVWLKRHDPTQFSKIEAAVEAFALRVEQTGKNLVASLDKNTTATNANTPAVVASVSTTPGKNGVAGVLTVTVTGDPKVDLPAINAAYFA
jgi:hypothetical protein